MHIFKQLINNNLYIGRGYSSLEEKRPDGWTHQKVILYGNVCPNHTATFIYGTWCSPI